MFKKQQIKIIKYLLKKIHIGTQWVIYRTRLIEDRYLEIVSKNAITAPPRTISQAPKKIQLRRILFIGDVMWEESQLFPELRRLAKLEVLDLRGDLRLAAVGEAAVATLRAIEGFHAVDAPDLVFFYARPTLLSEDVFEIIRQKWKCPILGMNLDDRVEYHDGIKRRDYRGYGRWAQKFDLNITSSKLAEEWYRTDGAAVRFMPQGFARNAAYSQPPGSADYKYPLSFVGALRPERAALVGKLEASGINVTVFGNGWNKSGWLDSPIEVYRSSQMNLGIGAILSAGNVTCLKGRDIECPATGACYLTSYHWELPELFEIGKEILCYRNHAELIEMHAYYSKRPELCLQIAKAAYKRAHAEHTWEQRMRVIFLEMGFVITPSPDQA